MSELVKLVVTVPVESADIVRAVVGKTGAGTVGKYVYCSFSSRGVGRFLPLDGARPAIGEVGQLEKVEEERIEFTCERAKITEIVDVLKSAHPYEEPAIDIYPLMNL